jgi:hypothetical protein
MRIVNGHQTPAAPVIFNKGTYLQNKRTQLFISRSIQEMAASDFGILCAGQIQSKIAALEDTEEQSPPEPSIPVPVIIQGRSCPLGQMWPLGVLIMPRFFWFLLWGLF